MISFRGRPRRARGGSLSAKTPAPPDETRAPSSEADLRSAPLAAGRYRLKRVIARGGMGMVYLAEHVQLRRPVALKVLTPPPGADDDGSFQRRFQLEAETLAALDHPNIVTLFDYGQLEDGRYFLAMEYIDGPRFTDVVRDGPMPPERALRLLIQVCTALRYAHRRGLVHRDLKPSNLLIRLDDEGGELVKVVDFGLVKVAEAEQSLTRAGHVLGSPHCMAPEQVNGGEIDHRADIYAIGVLLFRSITGAYPFHGSSAAATMIAHLKEPIPSLESVVPDLSVPAGLELIIRRCLEKEPEQRYANVDDLIRDMAGCINVPADQFQSVSLSQSLSGARPAVRVPPPPEPPEPAPSRVGLWVSLGLMAALGAGAMVVGALWIQREEPPPVAPPPVAAVPAETPAAPPVEAPAVQVHPPEEPAATTAPATTNAPAQTPRTPGKKRAGTTNTTDPKTATEPDKTPDKSKQAPEGYLGLPEDF